MMWIVQNFNDLGNLDCNKLKSCLVLKLSCHSACRQFYSMNIGVASKVERMIEESGYLQSATVVQTDNACRAVVTNLLAECGICHLKGRPAQPWTNGGAKRFMSAISTF